jgi:hypothetical protein
MNMNDIERQIKIEADGIHDGIIRYAHETIKGAHI